MRYHLAGVQKLTFAKLDLEMSFVNGEDVMKCTEDLVKYLWAVVLNTELPENFPRMTYQQAMADFGCDKPDLRLGLRISRVDQFLPKGLIKKMSSLDDPIVECLVINMGNLSPGPDTTRKEIYEYLESSDCSCFHENPHGGPGIFIFDSTKPLQGLQAFGFEAAETLQNLFPLEDGDLIVLQARPDSPFAGGSTALGRLGLSIHGHAVKKGLLNPPAGWKPLWITDFPLFTPTSSLEPGQGGNVSLVSTHHPFTSPKSAKDVDLLAAEPSKVIGEHYDLVINGVELGGGSRRIHNADMQKYVLQDVLKMSDERVADFSHLVEVLRAGCPPHAGIALGFDRLLAVMLERGSVRDVIAFPKSGKGEDLLVKSPAKMSDEALEVYGLKLRE